MKQNAPPTVSASAAHTNHTGRMRGLHQLLGREFLDRRQEVAADPVGPDAAGGGEQAALEIARGRWRHRRAAAPRRCPRREGEERPPAPLAGGASTGGPSPRASLPSTRAAVRRPARRPPSAIARRCVRTSRAARRRARWRAPVRAPRRPRRRDPRAARRRRRSSGSASRLRSGGKRLLDVAHREDSDAVEPQPLEGVLEHLRNALDDHDDRGRSGSGGAADLIFDDRPARRAEAARARPPLSSS